MSLSKSRSLVFIIAVLLLTNIAVLGYFLWFKKPHHFGGEGHRGITTALQKEVGFNEQQIAQYKEIKEKEWGTMKSMFLDIRRAKDSLFRLLHTEHVSDSIIDATAEVIAQKQKTLDLHAFNHFRQIRALCTTEQRPKYDSLVQQLVKKMGKPFRGESSKSEKD